jgi:hypothetical protein
MFPHERSLVKRMADKRFVLLGVNSDKDREECKSKNKTEEITWRSFWNGEQGTQGPISKAWEVRGWPTLYLIDHKGVVRRKFLGNPGDADLDRLIDELVERVEKDAAP